MRVQYVEIRALASSRIFTVRSAAPLAARHRKRVSQFIQQSAKRRFAYGSAVSKKERCTKRAFIKSARISGPTSTCRSPHARALSPGLAGLRNAVVYARIPRTALSCGGLSRWRLHRSTFAGRWIHDAGANGVRCLPFFGVPPSARLLATRTPSRRARFRVSRQGFPQGGIPKEP